jgi:hypothetical protein
MGKKAKLYLLVLVNLMVWGYVGYKVYGALQGDDDLNFATNQLPIKTIDKQTEVAIDVLNLNYPDPFLKNGNFSSNNYSNQNKNYNQNNNANPKPVNPIIAKATPTVAAKVLDIKYMGLVKNNSNGNFTALLSVNGKSTFVKPNDVVEGYTIKTITNESIMAVKGKEKLTISK